MKDNDTILFSDDTDSVLGVAEDFEADAPLGDAPTEPKRSKKLSRRAKNIILCSIIALLVFATLLYLAVSVFKFENPASDFEYTTSGGKVKITDYIGTDTTVVIPRRINGSPVTYIGDFAFQDCTGLGSITIPDSVTDIRLGAFYGCTGLTSVTIPDSVTTIGYGAFLDCPNLTIYCEATEKPSGWHDYWNSGDRTVIWGYTGE